MMRTTIMTAVLLLSLLPAQMMQRVNAADATGVTATEITVGSTFPFSGPASALGNVGKGFMAYVNSINDKGGVNGRKIRLIALDDAYSPSKAVEQTRKLVESDEVAMLFSSLGTASLSATVKYLNIKKVPQLFILSGGTKFTNYTEYPYTTTGMPSYDAEGKVYAKYIMQKLPGARIAILYQNDDMGKDYVSAFRSYMRDDYDRLVVARPYEATDPTVDSQVVNLKSTGAEALFIGGTPKFTAQALRRVGEIGWKPLTIINLSSSSIAGTLVPAGLENSKGIISGGFLKDPIDARWADDQATQEYRAFLSKYLPAGDVAELTYELGAAQGEILEQVLKQCGSDLSRENIIRQARNLKDFTPRMTMPGILINTGPNNNQAWTSLQLKQFNGKSWEALGEPVRAGD